MLIFLRRITTGGSRPGPVDEVYDGVIHNADGTPISADQITDSVFEHGVDYLGYWISRAALSWAASHPDHQLPAEVDVVAHSTGGLVIRTYLQSRRLWWIGDDYGRPPRQWTGSSGGDQGGGWDPDHDVTTASSGPQSGDHGGSDAGGGDPVSA